MTDPRKDEGQQDTRPEPPPSGHGADGGSPSGGRNGTSREGLDRSLVYFLTVAVGQVMSFGLLPFVTRALTPDAYGSYALALAVSGLGGVIASSWIRNVGLRLYFDAALRSTTRGFFLGAAALQAASFVLVYSAMLAVMVVVGAELASWRVLLSAGVAILLGDAAAWTLSILRAERAVAGFAVGEIGAGVLRFGLTLFGLALGARSAALLFDAASAGFLVATAAVLPLLWRRMEGAARLDVAGVREILRFGPASLPFSLGDWTERLADRLVIEHFLGTATVGIYSVGYMIGERTIGALERAVWMMAWPNILAAANDGGTPEVREAVGEAQRLYTWFTTGPVLFMMLYSDDLVRLIVGSAYGASTMIIPIVSVSMWLGGFTRYLNRHFELQKRFATLSVVTLSGAAVNVVMNIVLVPMMGMLGAAWATMANRVFNALVFFVTRDRSIVSMPYAPFAFALGTCGVAWSIATVLPGGPLLRMVVFACVYAVVALRAMRK